MDTPRRTIDEVSTQSDVCRLIAAYQEKLIPYSYVLGNRSDYLATCLGIADFKGIPIETLFEAGAYFGVPHDINGSVAYSSSISVFMALCNSEQELGFRYMGYDPYGGRLLNLSLDFDRKETRKFFPAERQKIRNRIPAMCTGDFKTFNDSVDECNHPIITSSNTLTTPNLKWDNPFWKLS